MQKKVTEFYKLLIIIKEYLEHNKCRRVLNISQQEPLSTSKRCTNERKSSAKHKIKEKYYIKKKYSPHETKLKFWNRENTI